MRPSARIPAPPLVCVCLGNGGGEKSQVARLLRVGGAARRGSSVGVQEGLQAAVGVLGQLPLGPACTAPPLLRTPLPSGPCSHPWLLPGHPGLLPASEVHLGLRCARCVCCVQRPLPPALGPLPLLSAPGECGPGARGPGRRQNKPALFSCWGRAGRQAAGRPLTWTGASARGAFWTSQGCGGGRGAPRGWGQRAAPGPCPSGPGRGSPPTLAK